VFLIIRKIAFQIDILTSPIFIISMLAAMTGFQAILMGLIAELLVRTYHESQQKPTYTVRRVLRGKAESNNHPATGEIPDTILELSKINGGAE
jgi:hypothetical protein